MMNKHAAPAPYVQPYRYASPNIPLAAIRRFARQIAERFHPDKIILFGSYAYGRPHEESDVDLLVIMPAHDVVNQSIRICVAFETWPFSIDLIVRTPEQIEHGLKQNNWFLREIMEKGKVLYDARNGSVGPVRRRGLGSGKRSRRARKPPHRNASCFHCQLAAEKYLKALLQELGHVVPRTHILNDLLDLLLSYDPTLAPLRRSAKSLTPYAVGSRYPGPRATTRRMQAALRQAERVRTELRARLGLPP